MSTPTPPAGDTEEIPVIDFTEDPGYQAFVESMAPFCHCFDGGPCDGVLAGGLCDGLRREEAFERWEDDE